ncbi:MAG: hypothetical protein H6872_14040 [Methylobacteriaceae bacterium]|nr:hypothetical protein [Rhodoblastus sp.]MCC0006182.1 hypothetical protein [Methylobacteriaceae bacterium]
MVRIARLIGFFFSAVGVELASGVGLVALVVAALLGWKRAGVHWLLAPAVAGAIAAQTMFAGVSTGGKVVNAMSNGAFQLIVYIFICLAGYGLGALARRAGGKT